MAAAGVPDRAAPTSARRPSEVDDALDAFGAPYVVKDDGLAAGKGVVVTDDRDEALAHAPRLPGQARRPRSSSRSSSTAPRCRCSASATARPSCRCCRRRTSSASATATPAPTPAAWAPTRRSTGRPPGWSTRSSTGSPQPTSTRCAAAAPRSSACSTSGLALTSRGPAGRSSSTPASATPRPRSCSPGCAPRSAACCSRPPTGPARRRGRRCAGPTDAAVTVVVAADNYPGTPRTGDPITGLAERPDRRLRAARRHRARDADGTLVSAGGRVLSVVAHRRRPRAGARAAPTAGGRRSSSTARTTAPTSRCAPPRAGRRCRAPPDRATPPCGRRARRRLIRPVLWVRTTPARDRNRAAVDPARPAGPGDERRPRPGSRRST